MDVSIVVPFYNEEESIAPLCDAVRAVMEKLTYEYEVIMVDDGSIDATFDEALKVAETDERFRVIKLSKNFGQTAALYAGIEHARGEVLITMDGDLQNDPVDIEKFVAKLKEGYDVVLGWRDDRKDRLISRKIPSRMANWLIRRVAETPIRDNGCAMRAYRSSVIKQFPLYSEMHRLLPTLLAVSGAKITQLKVIHHPRKFGSSKYGLSRIYKVVFDLVALKTIMTSYKYPLFAFGFLSLFFALISVFFASIAIAQVLTQPENPIVIWLGVSMLWGTLSIALLMLGILCPLIYTRGKFKAENLLIVDAM